MSPNHRKQPYSASVTIQVGTGQHIINFAEAFPNIIWQPIDIDADRLKSIAIWSVVSNLPNILNPEILNATSNGWSPDWHGQNLMILSNLLHLITDSEVLNVITQSAKALSSGGVSLIYGHSCGVRNPPVKTTRTFAKA